MKNIRFILSVAIVSATLFSGCSKKDPLISDLDKSYKVWLDFKGSVNNSYYYVAQVNNLNTSSETKITIANGEIVARDYVLYGGYEYTPGTNTTTRKIVKEWHEIEKTIGTHGAEGADLYTIDDLYQRAKDVWLKADKSKYDVVFESNNNGMISAAGYGVRGCVDDCFIGVKISSISK